MWMIHAGRGAWLVDEFKKGNYVAIGWQDIGDLSLVKTPAELRRRCIDVYPDLAPGKRGMRIGQIMRFRFEMQKGDKVVTYNPELRIYLVGKIISDYIYKENSPGNFNHIRNVEWIGSVNRDDLSVATKNALGAIMTLFLLSDSARDEILELLSGKKLEKKDIESEETEIEDIRKNVMEQAFEFIKDKILKLDWDEMQELVAGILRAMGYKTRVAGPGSDLGADVIASPDGLGLEQPRIKVEVKHREGPIGAPLIRSFIGGLRSTDRGLYVSTGGFTKEAKYEIQRASVPVTAIDIDNLAELLIKNYDKLDMEAKALVPLIKLYWPA